MLDAGVLIRIELLRPAALRWDLMPAAQQEKLVRALDYLDADASFATAPFSIGTIALVCVLEWLQFRQIMDDWRPGRPRLTQWYESVANRPSFVSTRPV